MCNRSCNCLIVVDRLLLLLRTLALTIGLVSMHTQTHGQSVTMALDTTTIAIGDQTRLTIVGIRDIRQNQADFSWPDWKDSIPGGLELLGPFETDTLVVDLENGSVAFAIRRMYMVTCWDSGFIAIPPVGIPYGADTIFSNSLELTVLLAPRGEAGEIAGAADIRTTEWSLSERFIQWLPWILAVISAIGLSVWVIRKWRAREPSQEKEAPLESIPTEPAHLIALRDLERIESDAIWANGDVKKHHSNTSEALRRYLEGRFEFRALERSTEEIKRGIPNLPLLSEDAETLLNVLELTDLVKFAKWNPTADDHIRVVKRAIRFVEQTLPNLEATESNSTS